MKIALDAHGGDFGIDPNIEGALLAIEKFDCDILLVGDKYVLQAELASRKIKNPRLSIVHAPDTIDMAAEPAMECREKPNSSIMVCADLVGRGDADAMVSAGNSGASVAASFFKMGRIKGVSKPAITIPVPTTRGIAVLLDGGAITECKPENLLQFALMGSVYCREVLGVETPSIGILSVGEEETKGNALVKESIPLLKNSGLNFYGPVEGRDIPFGVTDIVVCDGFTGNIVLKLIEGMSKAVFTLVKDEINKRFFFKVGAALAKKAFKNVKDYSNPERFGGAPLLGVNGISVICHGKSTPFSIYNGIRVARELVKKDAIRKIKSGIAKLNDTLDKFK
jgi:phosphate acyltransferase